MIFPISLRVDSGHKGGYQRNTEVVLRAVIDCLPFHVKQVPAPKGAVYSIMRTVKLHKNKGQAGFRKATDKSFILGQPYSVSVQLNILAARFFGGSNNLGQIVTDSGFTTAELDECFTRYSERPQVLSQ